MSKVRASAVVAIAVQTMLAGCKSIDGTSPALIPNKALAVSRSLSIPLDTIVLGAAIAVVVDPLAPNWRIEEQALGGGRYAFVLTKKRFTTGGDGEAMPVLQRRIQGLARDKGYSGHTLQTYTEGIDSDMPIARRVARATVQFAAAPLAVAAPVEK